jgi:hypothetical protein
MLFGLVGSVDELLLGLPARVRGVLLEAGDGVRRLLQPSLEQPGLELRRRGQRDQRRHPLMQQLEAVIDGRAALAPDQVQLGLAVLPAAGQPERESAD